MPGASTVQRRMTDTLMLADVPWMATVIMGVAQPFAQLGWKPDWLPQSWTNPLPLFVALAVSGLMATYWVTVEQQGNRLQSLLITPVVAMMLFAASLGANNVAKAASTSTPPTVSDVQPQLDNVQRQNDLLQKQLDLERKRSAILAQPSVPPGANTSRRDDADGPPASRTTRMLAWIEGNAYAQPAPAGPNATGLTPDQKQATLEELEKQQKELEKQQRDLEKQRAEMPLKDSGIWKKF